MWEKFTAGPVTWEEAINYCENLSLTGFEDWELPNLKELRSLVDYNEYNPSIDVHYFPDTVLFQYW